MVTEVNDILEEYISENTRYAPWLVKTEEEIKVKLSPIEEKVLAAVVPVPAAIEDLVAATGLSTQEISVALTFLELQGLVRRLPGGLYLRC